MENVATEEILSNSDAPKRRFLVGDLVEVRMLEKGLRGSWHPAKVVEEHKRKRLVEYEELLEDDEKTKLKELVSVGRASDGDNLMGTLPLKSTPKKSRPVLRPRPPAHPDSQPLSWQEGVCVDCFYDDAWWEGVLAENITTINVEDVSIMSRKSEVEVLFSEENDISVMNVSQMRIGQEWDEETGNWSLKGCAQVPVVRPNKKRSQKKNSLPQRQSEISSGKQQQQQQASEVVTPVRSKETDAATETTSAERKAGDERIESELCDNTLALNCVVKNLLDAAEVVADSAPAYNGTGYGYGERLNMVLQGGGSSTVSLNVTAQVIHEPGKASPAVEEEPPLENEVEGNATDDPMAVEKVDVQSSPLEKIGNRAAQNEEAAQTLLKHAGWKISKSVRRKTGDVSWSCKSPKVSGAAVKSFSSLVKALNFEAYKGASDGTLRETTPQSSTFADKKDGVNEASPSKDNAAGEDEDENDEYAASARHILIKFGWEVFNGLRTGSDGQSAWLYRTPQAGTQPRKWFKNWRLAIEEQVKQGIHPPKDEANVANQNQKKRGDRDQNVTPVPPPKRATRRSSSAEGANGVDDGSVPSLAKSEEGPNSAPPGLPAGNYDSDVDGDDKREVDIVVNSGRKTTGVDHGQKLRRSNGTTLKNNSYLEKPFGSVSSFTQTDSAYILQVITHDFLKEQITVFVEKGDLIIKARYVMEEPCNDIPVRCSGSVSVRVTLPKDVEHQKITADFKTPLLTLTLPRSLTVPEEPLEIKIQ